MPIPAEWRGLLYWSIGLGIVAGAVGVGTGLYWRDFPSVITAGLFVLYFLTMLVALRSSRPTFLRLSAVLGVAILVWAVLRLFGALV